jgi:hypothetical protein
MFHDRSLRRIESVQLRIFHLEIDSHRFVLYLAKRLFLLDHLRDAVALQPTTVRGPGQRMTNRLAHDRLPFSLQARLDGPCPTSRPTISPPSPRNIPHPPLADSIINRNCPGLDSNQHSLSGTSPSSWRVCQFRHLGLGLIIYYSLLIVNVPFGDFADNAG